MNLDNTKGQSMYELVISIAIVGLTLLAFVGLMISSLSAVNYTRSKSRANSHAQQAMEWLRTQKDEDWSIFHTQANSHSGAGGFWLGGLDWSGSTPAILGTEFERRAYFVVNSISEVQVRVQVIWRDDRGLHASETSTNFTDWRAH